MHANRDMSPTKNTSYLSNPAVCTGKVQSGQDVWEKWGLPFPHMLFCSQKSFPAYDCHHNITHFEKMSTAGANHSLTESVSALKIAGGAKINFPLLAGSSTLPRGPHSEWLCLINRRHFRYGNMQWLPNSFPLQPSLSSTVGPRPALTRKLQGNMAHDPKVTSRLCQCAIHVIGHVEVHFSVGLRPTFWETLLFCILLYACGVWPVDCCNKINKGI